MIARRAYCEKHVAETMAQVEEGIERMGREIAHGRELLAQSRALSARISAALAEQNYKGGRP